MTINLADLGRRLKEARIGCGINQEEAAQAIGVSRTAIVHIEVGNRSISTLELADLARLYKRGIKSFFSDAGGEEDVLVALKRVSPDFEDHPELEMEIARFVSICEEGVQLQQILRFPPRSGPPDYDLPQPRSTMDAVEQGEQVAEEERHRLGLGENPIPDVADLISNEGVWASGANLPSEISGFFLTHSSIGMVILVNFHHVRARKRFSHAHEFAHALLDRRANNITVSSVSNRTDLPEVRANAFAASFLLPRRGVWSFLEHRQKGGPSRQEQSVYDFVTEETGTPEVRAQKRSAPASQKVTYQDAASMAQHFGVSYQAACYRLKGLGAVNKPELEALLEKEEYGRQYLRLLELLNDETETKRDRKLESQIVALAVEAFRREEISKGNLRDLSKLLEIPPKELITLAEAA